MQTTISAIIAGLLAFLFWIKLPKGTFASFFKSPSALGPAEKPSSSLALAYAALSLNIGITSIFGKLKPEWNPGESGELREMMKDTLGKILILLLALVIAPVFEEILFRGYLIDGFRFVFKRKPAIAIAVSAALFALCHGKTQIPGVFIFAFCLGTLRLRTGSLIPNIALHALNNLFGIAILYFTLLEPSYAIDAGLILTGVASLLFAFKTAFVTQS